jgi:hypothetical protein
VRGRKFLFDSLLENMQRVCGRNVRRYDHPVIVSQKSNCLSDTQPSGIDVRVFDVAGYGLLCLLLGAKGLERAKTCRKASVLCLLLGTSGYSGGSDMPKFFCSLSAVGHQGT